MNVTHATKPIGAEDFCAQIEVLAAIGDVKGAVMAITQRKLTPELADWLFSATQSWAERGWYEPMWQVCDIILSTMKDGHKMALVLAHRAHLFGDFRKMQHYAQRALAMNPSDPYARQVLCQLLLWDTGFKQGLEHYDARFDAHGEADAQDWREFPAPRWAGESLAGKHLYLWTEQGVGDILQFASFLPHLLAQKPAQVTFGTHAKLIPLLQRSFPHVRIEPETRAFDHAMAATLRNNAAAKEALQQMGEAADVQDGAFDVAAPIGDLMVHYLPEWIPAQEQRAYVKADDVRVAALKEQLGIEPGVRHVGISWHTTNVQTGAVRSIPLEHWRSILALPRCKFYSLQHDVDDVLIEAFCAANNCRIIRPDVDVKEDIDGLAALIACMDQIITIDNSNVHLAGALGVPTTLLLPMGCNYRWPIFESGGTVWYESVTIIRQKRAFDWTSVMQRMTYDLGSLLI